MERPTSAQGTPLTGDAFAAAAENHRHELRVHCYRMVGSFTEAEDLVQETLLRGWRHAHEVHEAQHLRAWLYKIATNACLDHLRSRGREVRATSSYADLPWLQPYPDRLLDLAESAHLEPDSHVVTRETIELTFLAVIQLLPPRQRAVLILKDVLGWPSADVAATLDLTTAAANSALQRAREALRNHLPPDRREAWSAPRPTPTEREVLDSYMAAYEAGDQQAALALLTEDIRVTMPPAPYLFEGLAQVQGLILRAEQEGRWRLVATSANRMPAAACYRESPDGRYMAFKVDVLAIRGAQIREITTFGAVSFSDFGLPEEIR